MTLNCAIIDDEPLARDLLESYVEKTPDLKLIGKYNSAVAAIKDLQEHRIDLLFLDIQMPDMTGIEFSRHVAAHTRIVFTTAFQQYAVEGFRANALDYLMKPITYDDFLQSVQKATEWFTLVEKSRTSTQETNQEYIYVKSDYKLVQIRLDDILYIEGLKDYLKIYVENQPRPIITLISMKNMETHLPSPRFMRVHRSFIVQMSKIKTVEKAQIIFDKCRITISDSYKNEIMQYLEKHTL